MLKQDLLLQIMNLIDQCLKKNIGLMKNELGGKIVREFVGLRSKRYSYLTDNNDEDKKCTKKFVIKRKLKFENYKSNLKATQFENKINYLKKMKLIYIVLKMVIKNS